MCDQTEVTYSSGDVVWVKLGPVWWPGQVQDYEKLPEEITANLRKKPIAVVKFFQEETFEYVKNLNQIYQYNCRKKEEFIKKGLDMVRNSNSREVPSNMKMFPNDIVMAEHLTGGDPNILDSKAFAPEQKSDYSDLFGTKKVSTKKLKAESLKKELKSRRHSGSPSRIKRQSLPTLPSTIPRLITHPRFITKALEGKSDHEVRIRCQTSMRIHDGDNSPTEEKYKCHQCDFQSTRLNVIVLHNKSHSASFIEAQNAIRARLKSREREYSLPLNSSNEQTPTTVTSRGRVKSLPKKLMDYTDEPPPKIFKERVSSSNKLSVKEELPEPPPKKSSVEKSPTKTPKILKASSEKLFVKRPLFGKRKTAKEKAEMAAKQKQENDAMKEILLKDWDDDDVNEEEVELERLKQALESTTSSSMDMDDSNSSLTDFEVDLAKDVSDKSAENVEEKPIMSENKPKDVKRDINSKVFEFDDSEDSLPVTINFRLKNQREKFTDDKFKKPKPPKPLSRVSPKSKTLVASNPSPTEKKIEDKETVELNEAFNALLEETIVPVLPEIPVSGFNKSASSLQISDQTSDISSSTDLMEVTESTETLENISSKVPLDVNLDPCVINDDHKMECTSSENEEIKSNEVSVFNSEVEEEMKEDQKNAEEVSACDPRVGMDVDLTLTGVATTTTKDMKSALELSSDEKGEEISEDSTATEISSTCDVTKSINEDSTEQTKNEKCSVQNPIKEIREQENLSYHKENSDISGCFDSEVNDNNVPDPNELVDKTVDFVLKSDHSGILHAKATSNANEMEQFHETCEVVASEYFPSDTNVSVINEEEIPGMKIESSVETKSLHIDVPSKHISSETVVNFSNENISEHPLATEIMNEETVIQQKDQIEVGKEEIIQQTTVETDDMISSQMNRSLHVAPTDNIMNVQLILPVDTEIETSSVQLQTQSSHQATTIETLVPSDEMSRSCQLEDQTLSQNLQDMELDINSMPVIIGGEDFIQPEQPKQTLMPIQPKYSESIVISPKTKLSNPKKTESIIMQLGEPSTSDQNVQSVIAIPSKGGRGGGRGGRSQKTTSKTIKLSAEALKNLGSLQKGGNQQVLILKTASGPDKQDQGSMQKNKGPLNMFQHGNKILIVNNPQMSGQNKIKLNPQQQQLLSVSGGKLAPGTRVFTSKVMATTTAQASVGTSKISTSRSSSKPTQKLVISKGGVLTNTSKSVIINNSGKLVTTMPATHTITTSKGQTLITQNVLNTKGSLILPSSSQGVSSGKTATIITSQALATSKGMILTPITSKGGTIISGNQKLRIVSSKAPLSGTRLVVQNPQGKLKIDAQQKSQQVKLIRGQSSGNTILIQTSQGIVAKSITSSTTTTAQPTIKAKEMVKTVMTTVPTQAKIRMTTPSPRKPQIVQTQLVQQPKILQQSPQVQHTQIVKTSPPVKKVTVQKMRPSPNILQKPPRKSTPRTPKSAANRLITPAVSTGEPIMLSTTSSIPVITQPTLVQGHVPQGSEGLVYLTVDEAGNYRQIDNKSLITFEGNASEAPRTIFIPADTRTQDIGNIFLAIDDSGNIVNITQPTSTSYTTESAAPSQDILAKALANTQVLQQETILPDMDVSSALSSTSMDSVVLSSSSFNEQAHYPAPSLSHSVLETSLTLNQPIMTPLEVPSSVSPNLSQLSSLSSNYNLLTQKQKLIRPSMPLLTEESLANQSRGEPVFLLDSSNNIIPATSGSQISFQLTLGDNNVIMTSSAGGEILPSTYQVVSGDLLTSEETHAMSRHEIVDCQSETSENVTYSILPHTETVSTETAQAAQHSVILREALETRQANLKSDQFLNSVEVHQSESLGESEQVNTDLTPQPVDQTDQQCTVIEKSELVEHYSDQLNEDKNVDPSMEEVKHSLKRSFGEEQMVSSSSDLEEDSKRVRLDER
uniref:PWWP domain-containing protein n=1 Tax=Graphocephala atropunctata TaxID=36148 RepID=A0A1B6L1R5_9HEMI